MKGGTRRQGRIALTNVGADAAEGHAPPKHSLRGKPIDDTSLNEAARLAMSICDPTPDQRGDADYKTAMCGEMTRRALQAAHARASKA